ncbi:ABC transporter [Streptomyces aidingensis]|uniref:ABC transporter n=1 Tax=Streptomyces aidingensis TaxID=910347 RepID=A0A1I1NG18_9ACTN|nr:ABC transporter [Streptomyces aidingensis]
MLTGVDPTVRPGEVVDLLGPNGSGKSSLPRCVCRRLRPDRGRMLLDGSDVWRTAPREVARTAAALAQDVPPDLENTVRQVVELVRIALDLGVTVPAALHDLQFASAVCDRLVVLRQGVLVLDGPGTEVVTEKPLSEVYGVAARVTPGPDGLPRVSLVLEQPPSRRGLRT